MSKNQYFQYNSPYSKPPSPNFRLQRTRSTAILKSKSFELTKESNPKSRQNCKAKKVCHKMSQTTYHILPQARMYHNFTFYPFRLDIVYNL